MSPTLDRSGRGAQARINARIVALASKDVATGKAAFVALRKLLSTGRLSAEDWLRIALLRGLEGDVLG